MNLFIGRMNTEYFAPFPRQIVIDQTGVIRYLSGQYDAHMVVRVIEGLLD